MEKRLDDYEVCTFAHPFGSITICLSPARPVMGSFSRTNYRSLQGPAPTSLSPAPPAGNHVKEKTDRGLIADSDAMVRDSNAGEWVR